MTNWYKQKTLLLLAICCWWSGAASNAFANGLEEEARECREINTAYQHVYGFETENHYINVCQLGNKFYYHRQSKLDSSSSIILPAEAIFRGSVFQATVGKVVYFVGTDSDRHYSSVMLNNNEVVLEPEINLAPVISSERTAEINSQNVSAEYSSNAREDSSGNRASLELDRPREDTEPTLVCANKKSALHPHLENWQKLIGKSTFSANKYAENNGYDFSFDQSNPELALITTSSGTVVNLAIAADNETVEEVCVEPKEDSLKQ